MIAKQQQLKELKHKTKVLTLKKKYLVEQCQKEKEKLDKLRSEVKKVR